MVPVGRWLLALGGGVVWGVCFGREPLLVAPWLALIPLLFLLGQPRAWLLGWAHGLAFWLTSIPWIAPTLVSYGQLPTWLAGLSLLALASYLALFSGLFAALGARIWRSGGWPALLGLPALWVVTEWLRGHLFGGFPWNLAAYSWLEVPGALPLAAWLGAFGISYLVLFANTGLALAMATRRWRMGALAVGLCLLLLPVAGRWVMASVAKSTVGPTVAVRVLQPNIGVLTEWDAERVEENYHRVLRMSSQACEASEPLLLWPESAVWPYSYSRDEGVQRDLAALTGKGCTVLLNTSISADEGAYNSVILVGENGVEGRYDKRHLVPFGEFVPMADRLPFLKKIARQAGSFLAGDSVALLGWSQQQLGTAICFEVTFPEEVAEQVREGATILVTVTNDAWYGDSWAPWQHYRAARFRAAESQRYLLRAAITGVSAIIRPDGSEEQRLDVGEEGVLGGRVSGLNGLSLYSRWPWIVPIVCMVVAAFAIFLSRRGSSL